MISSHNYNQPKSPTSDPGTNLDSVINTENSPSTELRSLRKSKILDINKLNLNKEKKLNRYLHEVGTLPNGKIINIKLDNP